MQNVNKQLGNGSIIHRCSYYKHILVINKVQILIFKRAFDPGQVRYIIIVQVRYIIIVQVRYIIIVQVRYIIIEAK
jgi:hypothetical protein